MNSQLSNLLFKFAISKTIHTAKFAESLIMVLKQDLCLTDICRQMLKMIIATNQSTAMLINDTIDFKSELHFMRCYIQYYHGT